MGMAVLSKQYADAGPLEFLFFMSMISVSLGIMNLLPIPPLDGGRFVIEVFQKLTKRQVGYKAMNIMTMTAWRCSWGSSYSCSTKTFSGLSLEIGRATEFGKSAFLARMKKLISGLAIMRVRFLFGWVLLCQCVHG